MKTAKFLLALAMPLALMFAAVPASARSTALEDALTKASKKIAGRAEIPQDAKFAFLDFRETTSNLRLNLSYAIEDELSIALIREMPGRLMIKNSTESLLSKISADRETLFNNLENLQSFGSIAGADYLISGSYYFDSEYAIININVISLKNGLMLVSERIKVKRAELSRKLQPKTAERAKRAI